MDAINSRRLSGVWDRPHNSVFDRHGSPTDELGRAALPRSPLPAISGAQQRRPTNDRFMAAMLGVILLALAGCASTKPNGSDSARFSQPQTRITEINLLAMPVAINLDSVPGVDGFAIRVYAVDPSRPKTQPVESGTLEILMYDGLLKEVLPEIGQYRHVWSFTAQQLKACVFTSAIGTGYRFTLNWGTDQPRDDKITIAVRYRPAQGPAIYSAPSSITVPVK